MTAWDRDRIADLLARHYDGQPLADLRDEHATHHLEAADALLRDAAFTYLVRDGQQMRIGSHTYEGDGTEPCRTVLFGQRCGGVEPDHDLSEYRLTDAEKEALPGAGRA